MTLLNTLRTLFGVKTAAQKTYGAHMLPQPLAGLAPYPPKEFMAGQGVYAYRLDCMLSTADAARLMAWIRTSFPSVGEGVFQEGHHANAQGEAIDFAVRPGFEGATVELLTNARSLLLAMDILHLQPPAPWQVFPDVDPGTLGSLQGDIAYWWNAYWQPFWDAASTQERALYLVSKRANEEWTTFIGLRTPKSDRA